VGVWDIAALPAREQFSYWHEVICQAFVPLTPHRTLDEEGFAAKVETRGLAGTNRARLARAPSAPITVRARWPAPTAPTTS
jgi:AraC family transcriptional activator of tynA and feaB